MQKYKTLAYHQHPCLLLLLFRSIEIKNPERNRTTVDECLVASIVIFAPLTHSGSTILRFNSFVLFSDQNNSDRKRWVVIPCYNRMDNNPYFDHHHARATKLFKVGNLNCVRGAAFLCFFGPCPNFLLHVRKILSHFAQSVRKKFAYNTAIRLW